MQKLRCVACGKPLQTWHDHALPGENFQCRVRTPEEVVAVHRKITQESITALTEASKLVKRLFPLDYKNCDLVAEQKRRITNEIIEAIGTLRVELGERAFNVFTRQYTRAEDNDDVEDFDTFKDAMAFVNRRPSSTRAWINGVEI